MKIVPAFFPHQPFAHLTKLLIIVLVVAAGLSFISSSQAQQSDDLVTQPPDVDRMIEGWRAELDQITRAIGREGITNDELLAFRQRVSVVRDASVDFAQEITPRIQSLTARLDTLTQAADASLVQSDDDVSPSQDNEAEETAQTDPVQTNDEAPKDQPAEEGVQSEAQKALADDIAELDGQVKRLNAQLGRTEVITLRSVELITNITDIRRNKLASELLGTAPSILVPQLWLAALEDVGPFLNGLSALIISGSKRVLDDVPILFVLTLSVSVFVTFILLYVFQPLRMPKKQWVQEGEGQPQFTGRRFHALRMLTRSLIFFVLVPATLLFVLDQANVLSARLSELLWAVLSTLFYYALARGLSRAIFSPFEPERRIISFNDNEARHAHRTVVICLTIALIGGLIADFGRTLAASFEFIVVTYGVMSISFAVIALRSYFIQKKLGEKRHVPDILMIRILALFIFLGLLTALFAPIFGYPFLASFAVGQVILAGIIAAILFLCFALLDKYLGTDRNLAEDGVTVVRASDAKDQRYQQMAMLISGVSKILLTLLGLAVFAAAWGLDTTGIWADLIRLFKEIKIGEFSFSPSTLFAGLVVLVLGILVTRTLKHWLANRFLPTTALDVGLRNSITTGLGYIGVIISAMLAFSMAGLDLSNLAIVAGALSLGIGFGLQSVVSNFVSGIILLAERPIKAGDWIVVGGEEGTVSKISVRSTEIQTFDRATVIVPNADFITGSVRNMMYGNTVGRFIVRVGVSYDSDPDEVKAILLEVANNHPLVLAYPESYVIFADFGASSLDFELRGYLADCGKGLSVRSDLRFAIFKRLKEAGIEIPFPQQDLNIRNAEGLVEQIVQPKKLSKHQTTHDALRAPSRRGEFEGDTDTGEAE